MTKLILDTNGKSINIYGTFEEVEDDLKIIINKGIIYTL